MDRADINHKRARDLLAWYDLHGRELPWRKKGGALAEPYHVWLSEIMLQQTTVAAVAPYFAKFLSAFPALEDLAAARDELVMEMWAGLGYYARARNLLKCARVVVAEHGGHFPQDLSDLKALPGIGDYTAAALRAIAFNKPAAVVDGNVERVITRLFAMPDELPKIKTDIKRHVAQMVPQDRPGDFAQATMDLGATICTPTNPKCLICPWAEACNAKAQGTQHLFPVKPPKKQKPKRYGTVYWLESDGQVFLIRRPDKGLLGGMRALPSTQWVEDGTAADAAPTQGDWQTLSAQVRHVFTHFELHLTVKVLSISPRPDLQGGSWKEITPDLPKTLPTVMKKAAKIALTR